MSIKANAFLISLIALAFSSGMVVEASGSLETKTFASQPGDTLIIQNDYGRIQVRAWESSQLEAKIRRVAAEDDQRGHVSVVAQKKADKIFVYSFFTATPGESVDIEIQAPKFMNVVIWGANPSVALQGIQGYARVHTLTGPIRAEDLTSSVSIISERGEIHLRLGAQPSGDVRLESTFGDIRCELGENLNVRGWVKAGGVLTWGNGDQLQGGSLERQIGAGGPLLYASSLQGNVQCSFQGNVASRIVETGKAPARAAVSKRSSGASSVTSGRSYLRPRLPGPASAAPPAPAPGAARTRSGR